VAAAAAEVTEGGMSAAAALVTLASEPGIGVTELGRRVGLSQSAAVRMIDGLAARGLAVRETAGPPGRAARPAAPAAPAADPPGPDGRTVTLRLTPAGRRAARRVLSERERGLVQLLSPLNDDTLPALDAALSAVLDGLTGKGAPVHHTCRLCDERACTAVAPCPVDEAWQRGASGC